MFQYKILNDIIFPNKLLFNFKKVPLPLCSFRNSADETPLHIFYTCNINKRLWNERQYFVSQYLYIPEITPQSALIELFHIGNQKQFSINQPFTTNFQTSVYFKITWSCLFYWFEIAVDKDQNNRTEY